MTSSSFRALLRSRQLGMLCALVLMSLGFALGSEAFRDPVNLLDRTRLWTRAVSKRTWGAPKAAVAVTSTSGTLVVTDASGSPLRGAIMYDDGRGRDEAVALNARSEVPLGVGPSYSLVKAMWVRAHEPQIWERVRYLLHPTDWLTGKLSGSWGTSDTTNALKMGYAPDQTRWGPAVSAARIPVEMLPAIAPPGTMVGLVHADAAAETGISAGTSVVAGLTDGMASMVASGAHRPGHASTSLGTTLVWKVLSEKPLAQEGALYCHQHPSGLWAPGAASNTGPGSLTALPPETDAEVLNARAMSRLPTPVLCYRLGGCGERFPFDHPQAHGFIEGQPYDAEEARAAELQGLAFIERWGYDLLAKRKVAVADHVYSSGGAAMSDTFSQLRADVLNKEVIRRAHPSGAFGAALIAAAYAFYGRDILGAIEAMSGQQFIARPSPDRRCRYDELYANFRDACARRGDC